jgi:hypothetical protein
MNPKKKIPLKREFIIATRSMVAWKSNTITSVIDDYIERKLLPVKFTDSEGIKILDQESSIKRMKYIKKWSGKNYSDDELRTRLDSAIKHTHKWD